MPSVARSQATRSSEGDLVELEWKIRDLNLSGNPALSISSNEDIETKLDCLETVQLQANTKRVRFFQKQQRV
jgi:hypothetical protein